MIKENTLYYTEEFVRGRLLENNTLTTETQEMGINAQEVANILEQHISKYGHRCLAVYRDAFVHDGDAYNICLSCGDFLKNDTHYYLDDEGIGKINNLKHVRNKNKKES